MKLKYLKRVCEWKELEIEISESKCSAGDLLDKLYLPRIGWDVIVGGVLRSHEYILTKNMDIVLMRRKLEND